MNDLPPDATAWVHRHHEGMVAIWAHRAPDVVLDQAWAPLAAVADRLYPAYNADVRPERAAEAWPAATGERLRVIAAEMDPNSLFDAGLVLRTSEEDRREPTRSGIRAVGAHRGRRGRRSVSRR